ncbi:SDR family NAD(P)-dependent oxidoreductase [Egicoccus sp. AB-alg6-2]|uniref:SDR family NAD(P)-dependent oxidoreductase n=1 Tax=Egicoccus sp. AB-alg6-2 TaxID=3242692 RepID=UPI00359ED2DA
MNAPEVLVTGVSSGIGRATALHLAQLGFAVTGTVRDDAAGERIRSAADDQGTPIETLHLDLADPDACASAVGQRPWYGLVNNAGYFNAGLIEDVDRAAARAQFEVMVLAPLDLARLVLPAMRRRGGGRIVNVSSGIVHLGAPGTGWYQASKQALSAVSDQLRAEVAADGVEVVLVEPGGIRSEIWRRAEEDLRQLRAGSTKRSAYDRSLSIIEALEDRMHPPGLVAEAIGRALRVRRPRTRYRVGPEVAVLRAAHAVLPDRVRDRLVRTILGL